MIAPRRVARAGEREFAVYQRGEAWVIEVAGAEYFLTANDETDRQARQFVREQLRSLSDEEMRHPSLVASKRFPLLVTVDRVLVRAWPAFAPRGRGATTFENQATGLREATVKGPVWMFAAPKRPPSEGGTTNHQQTLADVVDMAKLWLRTDA